MLGVLPEYRNSGIGRRLKLRQRDDALARGIELIEWTFDPLELKNAFFNIERLGAIVRRYSENQYGITPARCTAACPPTAATPSGGSIRRACTQVLAGGAAGSARGGARSSYPAGHRAHPRGGPRARAPDPARQRRRNSTDAFERGLAVTGFERGANRRNLSAGAMGMKIERITLRQIRMPLVHFFETSFGRTYERHIILVEAQGDGISGWGEVTAGENPFYNEEWTGSAWLILRDYAAPRVLGRELDERRRMWRRSRRISAATMMARGGLEAAVWDLEARLRRRAAVAEDRRRRAARDPLRRLHRDSGFRRAAAGKDRRRTGRRLPAHQDEDQAGLGRGRGPPGARALPRHQADGRRQFGLHAGGCRPSEASSTIST